jgi:hypothetical protein
MLNAGGATLCNLANTTSGAMMAGRFSDALLKDLESVDPRNTTCYVFPQEDEFPNRPHRPKIFDYPLSRSSCPRETQHVQHVVKLLDGLLPELAKRYLLYPYMAYSDKGDSTPEWVSKVCVSCFVRLAI